MQHEAKLQQEDVTVTVTSVFNKRIAPKGLVFFVCKLHYSKRVWSNALLINRSEITAEQEHQLKEGMKSSFMDKVLKKCSEPVRRQPLKA